MSGRAPIHIPEILSVFPARWCERVDGLYRGFNTPELMPEALNVLERIVELLILYRQPSAPANFVDAEPDLTEGIRVWNVALEAVQAREQQPTKRTPEVLGSALRAIQAEDPAFQDTDEQTFALMMLRATLDGMAGSIFNSFDKLLWRSGTPARIDDPALVQPLVRLLRRCSELRDGDEEIMAGVPSLAVEVLPVDVLVPLMHGLLRDPSSTETLRESVRMNLDRYELPLPADT